MTPTVPAASASVIAGGCLLLAFRSPDTRFSAFFASLAVLSAIVAIFEARGKRV